MKKIEFKPTNYPSDLTDKEWALIEPFFPTGNKSMWHKRSLVDAVFYLVDNGCKWRALPHDYPPHDTVWSFYRRARESGLWEEILTAVVRKTRENAGRNPTPSYGLIDSQSTKTLYASDERGFDGGKKQKGESGT
jgi:putative transposase